MKKTVFTITGIAGLFLVSNMFAQSAKLDSKSGFVTCSEFHITKPLSEIAAENPVDESKLKGNGESEDREHNHPQQFKFSADKDGAAYGNEPSAMQTTMGTVAHNKSAIVNWTGQTAANMYPLDPSGAVGPNNVIQMINATTFKIYSKTGTTQLAATVLGNLWSPHLSYNDGDPTVLYDKAADRFILTQFGDNNGNNGNYVHIAVSTTGNPLGTWYTYDFTMPSFPDYVKFSVWQDGYYACANIGTAQQIFAFERTQMLAGNANSRMVYAGFTPPDQGNNWFQVPLPADAGDGTLPPAGTPLPVFSYSDNGWGGGYSDAIHIYNATVNWVPATPTMNIASAGNLSTIAFDGTYDQNWNDVIQPPSWNINNALDGIGGTMMYRAQYKVWGTYNSVVVNWGVLISSTTHQRSIMWAELRETGGVWSVYQQGIYTPDASTRWMGSIAMDDNGSIGLCYMKSSSSIYPGLYYTGRRACDPLGTLPLTEVTVKAGAGSQNGINRDGDYAETWLDPDGITFWHTGMWFDASGTQQTQIYSFQIPPTVATPIITQNGAVLTSNAATGNQWYLNGVMISGATSQSYTESVAGNYTDIVTVSSCPSHASNVVNVLTGITEYTENITLVVYPNPNNGQFSVSFTSDSKKSYQIKMYNNIGQLVFQKSLTDVVGNYTENVDISNMSKGVYMFSLMNDNIEVAKKMIVY